MKWSRSLLLGVAIAYIVSLVCGFIVARVLSEDSYGKYVAPTFSAMDQLEIEDARAAYNRGGAAALQVYLRRLDNAFGGHHYLLSGTGTDLVTGEAKAYLLPPAPATHFRGYIDRLFRLSQKTQDGKFWFVAADTNQPTGPATWAYFAVCIVVTTGLLIFSLVYLVFPLRSIRDAMQGFGRGELARRIPSRRHDEVGQLASAFNTMADQIEQSFRTEKLLLQDISHELRAPLARLSLAVHLAKQERPGEMIDQISSNVKRLNFLVGEITEFHQTWSANENDAPLCSVNLCEVASEVVAESALEAQSHGVEVGLTAASLTLESARPELVHRVLQNLLRNAILHARTGSKVDVSVTQAPGEAIVTVRDYGKGVLPEALERIFDPFYRDQIDTPGMGLGLSIARRGVQWHGGTIGAENASPGLRVTVHFPMPAAGNAVAPLKNS